MIHIKWFIPMALIVISFMSGMSTAIKEPVHTVDTIIVRDTIIETVWMDAPDGECHDGEFYPNAVVSNGN